MTICTPINCRINIYRTKNVSRNCNWHRPWHKYHRNIRYCDRVFLNGTHTRSQTYKDAHMRPQTRASIIKSLRLPAIQFSTFACDKKMPWHRKRIANMRHIRNASNTENNGSGSRLGDMLCCIETYLKHVEEFHLDWMMCSCASALIEWLGVEQYSVRARLIMIGFLKASVCETVAAQAEADTMARHITKTTFLF